MSLPSMIESVLIVSCKVVNALLTQLDKLKTKKNVLVMTTSNIAGAIGTSRDVSPAHR